MKRLLLVLMAIGLLSLLGPTPEPVSAATTYWVSPAGNDNNHGQFPIPCGTNCGPWATLSKVNAKTAASCSTSCAVAGDRFRLAAGGYWYGETVHLDKSGSSSSSIHLEKYGTGTDPIIHAGGPCIDITGNWVRVYKVYVTGCSGISQSTGISVSGDHAALDGVSAQNNQIGIYIKGTATMTTVINSTISNNQSGDGTGSSGNGLLLHGSYSDIHHNTFQNNHWTDGDGCRHGAAIEVYGDEGEAADNNIIQKNLAIDNEAFTELGVAVDQNGTPDDHSDDTRLGTADYNEYLFNVIRGSLAPTDCGSSTTCTQGLNGMAGFITRGDGLTENVSPGEGTAEYGPVLNTGIYNNSIYFTGECSQGIVCSGDCFDTEVIYVVNNISQAVWKGAFFGNVSEFDWSTVVDYNLFRKTGSQSGGQHCQFQSVPCPAMNGPFPYSDDPQYLSSTDLRPRCASEGTISPAIDAGYLFGFSTDYAGTSIPQDGDLDSTATPDIGAYERVC